MRGEVAERLPGNGPILRNGGHSANVLGDLVVNASGERFGTLPNLATGLRVLGDYREDKDVPAGVHVDCLDLAVDPKGITPK